MTDSGMNFHEKAPKIPPRILCIGMPVRVRSEVTDSIPTQITLQLAVDKFLHLKRDSLGWRETVEQVSWTIDTIVVSGSIRSNLYEAMDSAANGALPRSARIRLVTLLAEPIAEPDSKDAAHAAQDQRREREQVPAP